MYYAKETVKRLKEAREIIIFGTRLIAREVAYCLMSKPYELKISGFMVSELADGPGELMGLPVMDLAEGKRTHRDALIVIAVMERHLGEITEKLREFGFTNTLFLTFESGLWSGVRGNFFRYSWTQEGRAYLTLEEELEKVREREDPADVRIYRVQSHADKPVAADVSVYDWEVPIQAGTALTEVRISEIWDNQGENISEKNREYCELTALYWIWKNDHSKYAGLCHYRRHFDLDLELLSRLAVSDIDAVLTIPILNAPDVRTVYAHDHQESDWAVMLEAVAALRPDYVKTAEKLQRGNFYYGYNMLIARKNILDDYCAWLFPVLEYCEKRCGKKEDAYQGRYIGFLAERLLSVYFLHHENAYKIVHARKTYSGVWKGGGI